MYVFISYARPQKAVAEIIETYLKAAGVRIFRDTNEIRQGANWDMTMKRHCPSRADGAAAISFLDALS